MPETCPPDERLSLKRCRHRISNPGAGISELKKTGQLLLSTISVAFLRHGNNGGIGVYGETNDWQFRTAMGGLLWLGRMLLPVGQLLEKVHWSWQSPAGADLRWLGI